MRTTLLAVLLFSCTSQTIEPCPRMPLIISDSLPVQFWVNGEETFNEKEVCGIIKQDCFCQPFNCDDEITVQFTGTPSTEYQLAMIDTTGTILQLYEFQEIASGVFQATFQQDSSPGCEKIYLSIIEQGDQLITNGEFNTNTQGWSNLSTGNPAPGVAWSSSIVSGDAFTTTSISQGWTSREFVWSFGYVLAAGAYKIEIKDGDSNPNTSIRWTVRFYLQDDVVHEVTMDIDDLETGMQTFLVDSSFNAISFSATRLNVGFSQAYIDYIRLYSFDEAAKSDCLDFRESHDCTTLIEYENTSDFDGIDYETGSPGPSFFLRIPAIFFEEDNPQEQEDLELSNGVIVTLRQSIVEKRKLETGFMPNYMHRKLQKILMHDSVYIDGDYWKKRDSYDTSPVKKYNLKTASVMLTKYDSVEKNTI